MGSVEAHGPHLPLDTDTRIAQHLAEECSRLWNAEGRGEAIVFPPVTATASSYASNFPGTVSVSRETEAAVLRETLQALRQAGAGRIVLVNLHFDPEHMQVLKEIVNAFRERLIFPDFTRRAAAQRIGGEFATGSCHAGAFETSLMLVAAPHLVRPIYRNLPARNVNLAEAIRAGRRSFQELGLVEAYCGEPAAATAEEGQRLYGLLARLIREQIGSD